jgi:deoxycytidylate deaminase
MQHKRKLSNVNELNKDTTLAVEYPRHSGEYIAGKFVDFSSIDSANFWFRPFPKVIGDGITFIPEKKVEPFEVSPFNDQVWIMETVAQIMVKALKSDPIKEMRERSLAEDGYRVHRETSSKLEAAMAEIQVLADKLSHDPKTQVGSALLCPDTFRSLATSVNGFIPGAADDILPNVSPYKHTYMRHAEGNLVRYCARKGIAMEGKVVMVTHSPCYACARDLWDAGIKEVYFSVFHKMTAETFLNKMDLTYELENTKYPEIVKMKLSTLNTRQATRVGKAAGILP